MGFATIRLYEGRFADAERHITDAFALGMRDLKSAGVVEVHEAQLYQLRREQGRLDEMEAPLQRLIDRREGSHLIRTSLSIVWAEQGDREKAMPRFEHALNSLHGETAPELAMMLTEAAALMGLRAPAPRLYEMLLPFEHLNFLYRAGAVSAGSTARSLGMLATLMERWGDADGHFQNALQMNRQMRARPWVANTQYEYARMLHARDEGDDRERAATLLNDASCTAQELGMKRLTDVVACA